MDFDKRKKVAYVVFVGRIPGLYFSWGEAYPSVNGFRGAVFKGYYTENDAIQAWDRYEQDERLPYKPKKNAARTELVKPKLLNAVSKEHISVIAERARRLVTTKRSGHTSTCDCNSFPACLHL